MARELGVASVCVLPYWVARCAEALAASGVRCSTTVGFPHGGHAISTKLHETECALKDGCEEIDMLVNVSRVVSEDWDYVESEIAQVVGLVHSAAQRIKIIFENCYLDRAQKIRLCRICGEQRCDWVKTSTGFGPGGATLEDLRLMREHTPQAVQIKASGGIRSVDTVRQMLGLGATRIGTSRTQALLQELQAPLKAPQY